MDDKMVRTQVYLTREIHDHLKRRADEAGVSMAHQIREALVQYIAGGEAAADDAERYAIAADDPVWQMIGMGAGGPADGAVNHDAVLYGPRPDAASADA